MSLSNKAIGIFAVLLSCILVILILTNSGIGTSGTYTLTGRVTDQSGNPLSGAYLVIEGTELSTTTDTNGTYTFSYSGISGDHFVTVNHVGFLTAGHMEWFGSNNYWGVVMSPGCTIHGRVTDADTGNPISNAEISSPGANLSGSSDFDGYYWVSYTSGNISGDYLWQAIKENYSIVTHQEWLGDTDNTWMIVMSQNSNSSMCSLTGRVTDQSGNPLSGAYLMIEESGLSTITDSNGSYSISHEVYNGDYYVTVTCNGYITMGHLEWMGSNNYWGVVMTPDITDTNYILTGRVTDQSGNPLSGAYLAIEGTNLSATTDADGNYSFTYSGISGDHYVTVICNGYLTTGHLEWFGSNNYWGVVMSPGSINSNYTLTGRVTDQSGNPLSGANLVIEDTGLSTTTDADGNYTFSYIGISGDHYVTVFCNGYLTTGHMEWFGSNNYWGVIMMPITIDANCTLIGRVTDQSGNPLSGAYLVIEGTMLSATTDSNGSYSISHEVYNGDYYVTVTCNGYITMGHLEWMGSNNTWDIQMG